MPRRIPASDRSAPAGEAAELADLVQAVARRLRHEFAQQLGPLGLTVAQVRVLRTLDRAGGSRRMHALADDLHIARRSLTTFVDDLEAAGHVRRCPDPDDRRGVVVELTPTGATTIDEVAAVRRDVAVGVFGGLDPDARRAAARALQPVVERPGGSSAGGGR